MNKAASNAKMKSRNDADEELSLSSSHEVVDSTHTSWDNTDTQRSESRRMKDLQEELTKKESEVVFKLRVLVIFVLMFAAAAVTGVIYLVTTNGEKGEFESTYEGSAGKVSPDEVTITYRSGFSEPYAFLFFLKMNLGIRSFRRYNC